MPVKPDRAWSGVLVGLLSVFAVYAASGSSIMDIINREKVEKLMAEKSVNGTSENHGRRFLVQNTVDVEEAFLVGEDEDHESEADYGPSERDSAQNGKRSLHDFVSNNIHKGRNIHRNHKHNMTGMPNFAAVLAGLTGFRAERILKSVNDGILITRKEYLRKDWCKTEPMVQKIREEGCLTRTVLNSFCYGQCNSFYIPQNSPGRKRNRKRPTGFDDADADLTFTSCGFCKPKRASWIFVTLRCPSTAVRFKRKRLQRIKQCRCIAETVGP